VLAILGTGTAWKAAFADMSARRLAVACGLRLLRTPPGPRGPVSAGERDARPERAHASDSAVGGAHLLESASPRTSLLDRPGIFIAIANNSHSHLR
jgi:hypothetical protein